MDLSNRLSEGLIKILHNTKWSVMNDVARWTEDIHQSKHLVPPPMTDEKMIQIKYDTTHSP